MTDDPRPVKYVVAQTGARRGYAVPAILHRAGMLERFYTDVCGNVGWGRWLSLLAHLPGFRKSFSKLSNRRVPDGVKEKTRTFMRPHVRWILGALRTRHDATARFREDTLRMLDLGEAASRAGFGEATHVYTMLTEFSPLMEAAKARGLKVVAEIYILISTERLLAEERRLFPDWEPAPPDWDAVRHELTPDDPLMNAVDYYLCPSEAVRDDLVANWAVPRHRTMVVPYGLSPDWLELEPQPQRGRILFAGTAELRKGIHYLAMAAEQLRQTGKDYEFRIAGNVSDEVRRQPVCRHLNFLGRVPRSSIREEFQRADIFVLPSLAEGSAEVTYEAMGAAVPLVTTAAAGSVARDGIEGRIIPSRDPAALAGALVEIIEDRQKRDRMASAARERAKDYTWPHYGTRLVEALRTLPET